MQYAAQSDRVPMSNHLTFFSLVRAEIFMFVLTKPLYLWYHILEVGWELPLSLNGEMSERLMEPVLKTGGAKALVGSNPTLSATIHFEIQKHTNIFPCRSTQVAEGAPLLRE